MRTVCATQVSFLLITSPSYRFPLRAEYARQVVCRPTRVLSTLYMSQVLISPARYLHKNEVPSNPAGQASQ